MGCSIVEQAPQPLGREFGFEGAEAVAVGEENGHGEVAAAVGDFEQAAAVNLGIAAVLVALHHGRLHARAVEQEERARSGWPRAGKACIPRGL